MTYLWWQDQEARRKVAAYHTLWELGQARAALRRMGEVLPAPPARSREAFADAIYDLTDDDTPRHLVVLDGGHGGSTKPHLERRPGPEASSQAVDGSKTLRVSFARSPGGVPQATQTQED